MTKISLAILLLIVSVFSTNFDILSTSVCVSVAQSGYCTRWEQNGTVKENYGSCFPADSYVNTEKGIKKMSEINIGDQILGFKDGVETFTEVTSWFHHEENTMSEYLKLEMN